MSLAERVKAGPPPTTPPGGLCGVGKVLNHLSTEDADALRVMLELDSGWLDPHIADALAGETNSPPSRLTIGRHRRGVCSCARRGIA